MLPQSPLFWCLSSPRVLCNNLCCEFTAAAFYRQSERVSERWFGLCKAFVVAWVILRVLIDGPEKIVIDGQAGAGSP